MKVIEKVVCEQTTKFLNDNIFYKYQSGFRNNHSTDLFLSFLNDKILKAFDSGVYTGMILTDLEKAFVMINHKICCPLLFLIYVSDMSQAVECNLHLYTDDLCLLFQHKNVTDIKKQLTKDFSNI